MKYPEKVIEHFRKPRNLGRIKDADAVGKAGNLVCGDVMYLYLKVRGNKKKKKVISDIKFECFGCIVAIAVSSILTTMVKGKTLEEALKIDKDKILKRIGGRLPPIKVHCSVLAADALHEAIYDYYKRNNLPIPKELEKRHEKIQKAMKELEKRHKEFLKLQERMIGK